MSSNTENKPWTNVQKRLKVINKWGAIDNSLLLLFKQFQILGIPMIYFRLYFIFREISSLQICLNHVKEN